MSWKRNFLNAKEEHQIEEAIAKLERDTGTELIICLVKASDPYPAAPLRFAFLFTLFVSVISTFLLEFAEILYFMAGQVAVFFIGLVLGHFPFIKKLSYSPREVTREVHEKALELFNSLGLTKTKLRVGVLLAISLSEHRIELVVGNTLKEKITQDDLNHIMSILEGHFVKKEYAEGILESIKTLEEKVTHFFPEKFEGSEINEISNKIIWEDFS